MLPKIDKIIAHRQKMDRMLRREVKIQSAPNRGSRVGWLPTITFVLNLVALAQLQLLPASPDVPGAFDLFVKLGGDGREIGGIAQFMFACVLMGLQRMACNSPFNVIPLLMAEGNPMTKAESKAHKNKVRWDPEKHQCLQLVMCKCAIIARARTRKRTSRNARCATHC